MKAVSIARACVMGAIVVAGLAAGCGAGNGGGPASLPIDPFGNEPATPTGNEPTNGGNEAPPPTNTGSILQLCEQACAHIQSSCPSSGSGSSCPSDCATSSPPGCEQQFRAFVACIATTQLICTNGGLDPSTCNAQLTALSACDSGTAGTSSGSSGAAGSGGGSV